MRRHGEVPAGQGRRGGEVSSLIEGGAAELPGQGGRPLPTPNPDNVFALFPPDPHRQPAVPHRGFPPDALTPPAQPKQPVSRPGRPEPRHRAKQAENVQEQSQGTPGSSQPGYHMPGQTHGATPAAPQAAPPVAPAEPPAWTQHPITKALEALHGPGGVATPTQIIAESLKGRADGWMPAVPLPPEQPVPPQQPDARHYPDPEPLTDMPVRELPGEEAAIAAEAKMALEQQFWQLWLTHQDQLRKQCMHMMSGNLADAEDALSSAMLRASQKFLEYSGSIMNEKAWLSKLVHNVCIDQYRQRKRTYYQAFEGDATEQVEEAMFTGPQPSPEEVALGKEQVAALETCLEQLSNNLRVPLMLRCVEGWSYPDIAEELDLRADTVRKRVQLARDFLRGRNIR